MLLTVGALSGTTVFFSGAGVSGSGTFAASAATDALRAARSNFLLRPSRSVEPTAVESSSELVSNKSAMLSVSTDMRR